MNTLNPRVTVNAKAWFTSKLNWLGIVQIVIGVLDLVKTNVLESEQAAWGAVVSGTVTIILRTFFTFRPVAAREKPVEISRNAS